MNNREAIAERLLDFAVRIIKLIDSLQKTYIGKHVSGQLARSATSAGSNYEEACGAESRADFIHKMGVVLKELKESRFWLRLIQQAELTGIDTAHILNECEQLCKIIAQGIITARGKHIPSK